MLYEVSKANINKEKLSCSPLWLTPKYTDDEGADALQWPPAVLLRHFLCGALTWGWRCFFTGWLGGLNSLACSNCFPQCVPCRSGSGRFSLAVRWHRLLCRLYRWLSDGLFLWPMNGGRCKNHLSIIRCHSTHKGFKLSFPLASVLELPQMPHHLNKVVARSFVVSGAGVRFPHKLTPVEALRAPAGNPQLCDFPLGFKVHAASIVSLGVKGDGVFPDVLPPAVISLRLSWPDAAGKQQSGGLDPHAVRGRLFDCWNWGDSLHLCAGKAES